MSQPPQGWIEVRLDSISKIVTGKTPSKKEDDYFGGNIPFIKPGDIFNQGFIQSTVEKITIKGAKTVPSIPGKSIVVTCIGNLGRVAITKKTSATNQQINTVIPNDTVDFKYLFYYLRTIREWMEKESSATTVAIINKTKFSAAPIRLPPSKKEQKRIADKLDSVLAKVEAAQARLDKIPTLLKRFRQSVLAAATSGELTKDWREGGEQYRDEHLTWLIKNIPSSWSLKLLPEVAKSRLGKMLDKNKNTGIATKYLSNISLRWHKFDLENLKEILVSQKEIEELSIQNGDLLLCEGGEPGRGAVWKGGENDLVFQKALHRIRCTDSLNPHFLLYCIEDDYFSKRLPLLYTGTTIKHLTGKALKNYPVRIPLISEQLEIVKIVDGLLERSKTVEKQYKAAKVRLDKLTQSILAKAFRGELLGITDQQVESELKQTMVQPVLR